MNLLTFAFLVVTGSVQVFSVPVDIYFSDNGGGITKYVEVTTSPVLEPAPSDQDEKIEEIPAEVADDKVEGGSDDTSEPEDGSKRFDYKFVVKNQGGKLFFSKSEKREGSQVTGAYSVLLPDGRVQVVEYVADKENGFVPKISYNENSPFESSD